jgi:hypothetical protein
VQEVHTRDWWHHFHPNHTNAVIAERHVDLQRGPFRVAQTYAAANASNEAKAQSWSPRDTFARWADGTSNQVIMGEKHLRPTEHRQCTNGNPRALFDCSYFYSAGEYQEYGVGRGAISFPRTFARGPNDELGTPQRLTSFGSAHPGIVNFVLGDGSVRPISISIPQDSIGAWDQINDLTIAGGRSVFTLLVHVNSGQAISIP